MSALRRDPVVAIACSDVHLSLRPPIARAEEPDWFEAMARPWRQITKLAEKYGVPILVAGDVFDRWNPPPELINWAIDTLPEVYAIPGQHDLPNHRADAEHRSAYGSLVRAGRIIPLDTEPMMEGNLFEGFLIELTGFPFGTRVKSPPRDDSQVKVLRIALVHEYLWVRGRGFHGAPKNQRVRKKASKFSGFDVVISGDNHIPFQIKLDSGTTIFNCGSLMRRRSDEVEHEPRVGLIRESGRVQSRRLNIDQDVITQLVKDGVSVDEHSSLKEFVQELASLEVAPLDFRETMIAAMAQEKVGDQVRDVIMEAMDQ